MLKVLLVFLACSVDEEACLEELAAIEQAEVSITLARLPVVCCVLTCYDAHCLPLSLLGGFTIAGDA